MKDKYVYYKNDKEKLLYKIKEDKDEFVLLVGVYIRMMKRCLKSEVRMATEEEIEKEEARNNDKYQMLQKINIRNNQFSCGKILHIDGDNEYLNRCIELYNKLGVYSYGIMLEESQIRNNIEKYIIELDPDVVVITGHDSYNGNNIKELSNYTNTKNFCEAIKKVRKIKGKNDIVVIAGACQSNFEALIASGANFASSPKRINIHTYDPAVIAVKVATTDFKKSVSMNNIERLIENGLDAFGGVDTLGKMRGLL